MALFKNEAFTPDPWRSLDDSEDIPQDGQVILTFERWRELRASQQTTNIPLGLRIEAGTAVEEILPDLPRLALVALVFPKYTDGRSFSAARKLRSYYGYSGELRAVGDVLFDQLQFMARCGFDSFEINDPVTISLLASGRRPGVQSFYQPGFGAEIPAGTRPWARRPA
jgi:phosphoadenosine phosphosulfate reductase